MKFIDLFAGIGGFRLGMERAGHKCVWSSEWDKDAQDTYQNNWGDRPLGDITKIDAKDIPNMDIICGGFPCQAFSIAGKQLGFAEPRGQLFFDVIRIAKYHKPKYMILENVKNLQSHDGGKTFAVIAKAIDDTGYNLYSKIISGTDFGVPQMRKRIFMVCIRKDIDKGYSFPPNIGCKTCVSDILEKGIKAKYVIRSDFTPHKTNNGIIKLGYFGKNGQGMRVYSPKGFGVTLCANGGGLGAKTGLYKVGTKIRKLSFREVARLSGFPDTFKIPNSTKAYKQCGNTVIPQIVTAIATNLK